MSLGGPRDAATSKLITRLDPRATVVCLFAFILAALLAPKGDWWRFGALAGLLVLACVLGGLRMGTALSRLWLLAPVVLLLAVSVLVIPVQSPDDAVHIPGLRHSLSASAIARYGSALCIAALSVVAVTVAVTSCGFERLVAALSSLRVPRLLLMLLTLTHRYIHLIGDEARRMGRARDSRGRPPALAGRARATGAIIGSLFIRSFERAERVTDAMVARGYDGTMRAMRQRSARFADMAVAGAFCMAALALAMAARGAGP